MERKMKPAETRKSVCFQIKHLLIVTLLICTASLTFTYGSSKGEKAKLNETFRNIAGEMKESYDNGDLERVIELYNKNCCIGEDGDTQGKPGKEKKEFKKVKKEIRADIYQWMSLSYVALDMPESGDIFLRKLLVLRRGEGTDRYWLSIRETAKNKYYVAPRLLLGLRGGINFTSARPGTPYSIMEHISKAGIEPYEKDYPVDLKHSCGTQLGLIVQYALGKHFWLGIVPSLTYLRFQYKNSIRWQESDFPITNDYFHYHRLTYIEIPFFLKYQFAERKLKPYFLVGGFSRILTYAYKTIKRRTTEKLMSQPELVITHDHSYEDLPIKKQIFRFDSGLLLGVGITYDTGIMGVRLAFEVNYKHGMNNIINEERRWANDSLIFGFYDVFDDIKIRNFDLSLQVLLPIYYKAFKR